MSTATQRFLPGPVSSAAFWVDPLEMTTCPQTEIHPHLKEARRGRNRCGRLGGIMVRKIWITPVVPGLVTLIAASIFIAGLSPSLAKAQPTTPTPDLFYLPLTSSNAGAASATPQPLELRSTRTVRGLLGAIEPTGGGPLCQLPAHHQRPTLLPDRLHAGHRTADCAVEPAGSRCPSLGHALHLRRSRHGRDQRAARRQPYRDLQFGCAATNRCAAPGRRQV